MFIYDYQSWRKREREMLQGFKGFKTKYSETNCAVVKWSLDLIGKQNVRDRIC